VQTHKRIKHESDGTRYKGNKLGRNHLNLSPSYSIQTPPTQILFLTCTTCSAAPSRYLAQLGTSMQCLAPFTAADVPCSHAFSRGPTPTHSLSSSSSSPWPSLEPAATRAALAPAAPLAPAGADEALFTVISTGKAGPRGPSAPRLKGSPT